MSIGYIGVAILVIAFYFYYRNSMKTFALLNALASVFFIIHAYLNSDWAIVLAQSTIILFIILKNEKK